MKKIAILILTIIASFSYGQDSVKISPNGIFDQVLTRYGNTVNLKDLIIDNRYTSSSTPKAVLLCSSGYFDLYFEVGSGMEGSTPTEIARRNVICQVFSDLSQFIQTPNSSVKVNILVKNINPELPGYNAISNPNPAATSGVLGLATGYYVVPSGAPLSINGIADNEIWKTINSGIDSYTNVVSPLITTAGPGAGFYHGMVAFNFSNPGMNWHLDLTTPTATSLHDMYTVALHEVTHALGFASLIDVNGNSKFGASYKYYSRYDLKLTTQANQNLITNSGACSMYNYGFNPSLNTNIMTPSPFNCSTHVKFAGTVNQSTYSPSVFTNESSLSHLEDQCHTPTSFPDDQYYVMSNANGTGTTYMKRFLKPEERGVLCDIGYKVNPTYGSAGNLTYNNYGGSTCPGLGTVGINDGITGLGTYQFIATAGGPGLNVNGVTLNDFNATSFECLQDIYGNGTVNVTAGTNFIYTATTPGLAVLRYIPVSSSGVRGNITYIYIYVSSGNCLPSACNIVNNTGFENSSTCGQMGYTPPPVNSDCWSPFSNTPDIFQRNCTNLSNGWNSTFSIPSNFGCIPATESWSGLPNNNFIGIASSGGTGTPHWNESLQTLLNYPLVPGNTYSVSFRAKVANNFGTSFGPPLPAGALGQITLGATSTIMAPTSGPYTTLPAAITQLGTPNSVINNNTWQLFTQTFTYNGSVNGNNLVIINSSNMNTLVNQPYVYIYIDDIDLIEVTPATTLTFPSVLCLNQTISDMSIYSPVAGGVFTGPGVSVAGGIYSFNASTAGVGTHTISYTYTDNIGCVKTIYDQIQVVNSTITASATASTTTACNGQTITLTGTSAGATSFLWNPGNLSGATVNTVINSSTLYTLTATNAEGCIANASVFVNSAPIIVSVSPTNSTVCTGQQVSLAASGATTYTWTPTSGLSPTSGANVNASPSTTTTYTVTGTNALGCSGTATTIVNVIPCIDCSGGTNLTGTVSTSPAVGASLRIPNNITISGTVTFTNNNIKILPGVTITVLPTATLNIVGSHLYGCESMWQGINIQAGGKINIQPYVVAAIVQKTTLIEDATIALDFLPITTLQAAAVLQVNNATFNKNATAIKVQGYTFANAASIFSVKNSLFTCRQIYNTATPSVWPLTTTIKALNGNTNLFLEPYINTTTYPLTTMKSPMNTTFSEKGIHLINVGTTSATFPYTFNSITIGSTTTAEYNVFDYLKVDIHTENTNIKVINSTFQFPRTITNTLFSSMSSPNLGTGIFANAPSGAVYKVDVAGTSTQPNKFYGLSRALHTVKYRDIQFNYNTVRSNRQNAVPMGGYNNGRFGVYMLFDKYDNVLVSNNTIYNIDKGVYLNASISGQSPSVKILTNTFHNNLNTTYGARNSDAVLLENVLSTPNTGGLVWVNSNTIVGNARAITLNNWNRTTIQIKNNGIALVGHPSSSVVSHGIALNSCMQGSVATQIYENNISGFSINHPNFKGIALTSTIGNELRCNAVNNTYSGIYFSGNCNPTKTYNNSMENHRYGFVLDNGGVIGQQGTSTTPADNRWLGTWDPTGTPSGKFKNACLNTSTTDLSKMYVRIGGVYTPNLSTTSFAGNLTYVSTGPTITLFTVASPPIYSACATIAAPAELNLNPSETVSAIESTAVTTNNTSNLDMQAVLVNQTYRTLDADPTLTQNSTSLSTFYDATSTTNTAKLLNVEKAVSDNNTNLASSQNSSVSPQNSLEDSYKLFYDALLNYQNNNFTPTDSSIIYNIASDCPTLQGGVVYQSSALYNLVYSLAEVFENICPEYLDKSIQQSVNESENDPKSEAFQIYPIPNNGEFTLFGDLELGYKVLIKSVEGKIVFEEDIKEVSAKINVKTLLSSGAYSVLLINKEKVVFFEQNIIIVR